MLVHQVGIFTINKDGDGIGQVGVKATEWLDVDGAWFAAGLVAWGGFFQGGKGLRTEAVLMRIWYKFGGMQKLTVRLFSGNSE